jgi:hypothetical protein
MTMTPEQLAHIKKAEELKAARDLKKAARLGTLSAQQDAARFRENLRLERLRDRLLTPTQKGTAQ